MIPALSKDKSVYDVCLVAHIDPYGKVVFASSEWTGLTAKLPSRGHFYLDAWDHLSHGSSGVRQELSRCLEMCRRTDGTVQTTIVQWTPAGTSRRWHVSMHRMFNRFETEPEVVAVHTDVTEWIPSGQHQENGLEELLLARGDMIVFEHDLDGVFTLFHGAEKLLGYGSEDQQILRLDQLVQPECLEFAAQQVLAMHEKPGWTAAYETKWVAAGNSGMAAKRVRITSRMVSSLDQGLTIRGIAQIL